MTNYATVNDINTLWRTMTSDELNRAQALLPIVSSSLRYEAEKAGKDINVLIGNDPDFANVLKSVTVDVVSRVLMTSTNQEPMTQMSEAAGGYSASGTFLVPGGGLFIKKSELARLGFTRQRVGVIDFYGDD